MLGLDTKIFVTGSTGFIGSYIVRQLIETGYINISCLKRAQSEDVLLADVRDKIHWVEGDILDLPFLMDALSEIDCIIHAAALVSYNPKTNDKMIQTSVDGTANLVNVALDLNLKKFIHISSISAIGRKKPEEHISEAMMFSQSKYDTTYGLSKFLAEQEVWRGHAEGLNVTILNPSSVVGPGKWNHTSCKLFTHIYNGMKYFPAGTTGFVDVRDVAKAVLLSMDLKNNGERFIISAESWSFENVFNFIRKEINVNHSMKALTSNIAGIIWRIEALKSFFTGNNPTITRERTMSTFVKSSYDNSKSIQKLGMNYRDIPTSINETCQIFLQSYPNGKSFSVFPKEQ